MITGWESKPIGEVCTIKPPKAEARAKLADGHEVSFAPMEDLGIGVKYLKPHRTRQLAEVSGSYTYFADGDVLLAKITPCFENGKLGVARGLTNGVGFGSSEYIVLRPAATLDAEFLYYYLSRPTFLEEGARIMTGAVGHKRVTKEFVESYPIPLPPLREQRRIVAILDEAFEGIATAKANAERSLQNARELFESRRGQIFSAAGDDWTTVLLGDACSIARGGSPRPIKEFLTSEPEGVNWVKISDATASAKYIFATAEKIKRTGVARSRLVHDGDFLLSNSMSFGRPYIMRTTGCIHDGWLVLSDYQATFSQDFLYLLLSSSFVYQQFDRLAAGSTVRNLNIDLASSVRVPAPPLDAQVAIAAELDELSEAIDKLSNLCRQKVAAFVELKKSLLHQAFTGALTAKSTDKQVAEVA